jgi:transposase
LKTSKKPVNIEGMTTKEVAEKYNVSKYTVIKWCQKHNLKRKLSVNGIMEYILTEKDIKRFQIRKPKGRPKKQQNSK